MTAEVAAAARRSGLRRRNPLDGPDSSVYIEYIMAASIYDIRWTGRAERELGRLDAQGRSRVREAVSRLSVNPRGPGVRRLTGRGPEHRLRVGDYRVLFEIHDDILLVLVVAVRKREDAYE